MPPSSPAPLSILPRVVLKSGGGQLDSLPPEGPIEGLCVMQVVDLLSSGGQSDHPACACPVVTSFAIRLNDATWPNNEERTKALAPLIPLISGSRSTPAVQRARRFRCADWAVRELLPLVLDLRGFKDEAAMVRAIPPLIDAASAQSARDAVAPVRARLRAAWSAAAAAAADAADAAADAADAAAAAADAAAAAAADADAAAAAWSAAWSADAAAADADAAADAWSAAAADADADAAAARLAARQAARLGVLQKAVEFLKELCEMGRAA